MSELPQGWAEVRLDEISSIVTGKTPSKKKGEFFNGGIPFIKPGDVINQGLIESTVETITEEGAQTVPVIPAGAITVTCIGNLGRAALTKVRSATNQQINTAIPYDGISPNYLYYYALTLKEWMEKEASATTIAIINKTRFSAAPIKLAPLNEQIRIADKLDSMLAKVHVTQTRLDKTPSILKRFRQSVLAAATSGELTKEWREIQGKLKAISFDELLEKKSDLINKKLVKKDLELELLSELEIPSSWVVVNLGGLASKVTDGEHKTPKRESEGRYLLSARNVRDGLIKLDKVDYVGEEEFHKLRKRCDPNKGDILISCSGSVGRVTLCDKDDEYVMVRSAALVKTDLMEQNNKYLMYSLQSPVLQQIIVNKSKSTAQSNLFLGPIKELPIPLPPKEEQNEIVRRVESLFIMADTVEKQYNAAKIRTNRLTQSILAKAFRGELVAQDKNDESALILLDKIKTELISKSGKKTKKKVNSQASSITHKIRDLIKQEVIKKEPSNRASTRTKVGKKLTVSWSKSNSLYVDKAVNNLKESTFTIEQFQSVSGFNKSYDELKTLFLSLVKGTPGISDPLFEIVDWDEKTGEFRFKLKVKNEIN